MNTRPLNWVPKYPAIDNVGGSNPLKIGNLGGSLGDLIMGLNVLSVTQHLTAAQIKACFTTPIVLVNAPGAGLINLPLALISSLAYGTTTYVDGGTFDLCYLNGDGVLCGTNLSSVLVHGASMEGICTAFKFTSAPPSAMVNQPLVISDDPNPTTGDGSMNVTLLYAVVSA